MKRYLIETSVENAEGSQCWYVDASSESEALEKYREGGCDLYSSDVDVTSLGEPEISGETTLDDFGDFAEKPAQPQQEPVAAKHIGWDYLDNGTLVATYAVPVPKRIAPKLYTSPPAQRKPLTDGEIWKFWWSRPEVPDGEDDSMEAEFVAAVRRVLAAHGIKENT